MKTYVITLLSKFPVGHARAGEQTFFREKFLLAIGCPDCKTEQDLSGENISDCNGCWAATKEPKLHTIRANFPLWEKRIAEVQRGEACLSVRQWSGAPYKSPQVEIGCLTAEDGVGLQCLEITSDLSECIINGKHYSYVEVAKNDGLHAGDWIDWFKTYELFKPLTIIHFTKFRY